MFKRIIEYLKKDNSFLAHSSMLFAATITASAISYIYQFTMGRFLGPADYGIIGTLSAIIHFFLAIVNAIQTVTAKFVSVLKAKAEMSKLGWLLKRLSTKMFLAGIGLFFVFAALSGPIAAFLSMAPQHIIIFGTIFIAMFLVSGLRGFLQGLQKFRSFGVSAIIEGLLKLGLAIGLLTLGFGVSGAIAGFGASMILATLFTFIPLIRIWKSAQPYHIDSKALYSYSGPVLAAMTAVTALYTLDVVLAKHFLSPVEAGHYAAASILAKIIFFGTMAISQVMFPKISEMHATNKEYSSIFRKAMVFTGTIFYYALPKLVVSLLFGPEYYDIIPIIGPFGLAIALFSISFVFVNYFLSTNKNRFVYFVLPFVAIEIIGITLFHNSITQIAYVLVFVMFGLLASLFAYYAYTKTKNETVNNNTSIQ